MVRKTHQSNGHTGSACSDKPVLGQGGGGTLKLNDSHGFKYPTQSHSPALTCLPLQVRTAAKVPFLSQHYHSTPMFCSFQVAQQVQKPMVKQLKYWDCERLMELLNTFLAFTYIYSDGSDVPSSDIPLGPASVISMPKGFTALCALSPTCVYSKCSE